MSRVNTITPGGNSILNEDDGCLLSLPTYEQPFVLSAALLPQRSGSSQASRTAASTAVAAHHIGGSTPMYGLSWPPRRVHLARCWRKKRALSHSHKTLNAGEKLLCQVPSPLFQYGVSVAMISCWMPFALLISENASLTNSPTTSDLTRSAMNGVTLLRAFVPDRRNVVLFKGLLHEARPAKRE